MEHPILFSAPMVNAILEGRKSQTRRVMKTQMPENFWRTGGVDIAGDYAYAVPLADDEKNDRLLDECKFPYGNIGDRLWVRENIRFGKGYDGVKPKDIPKEPHIKRWYEADTGLGQVPHGFGVLRPSIFMPRYFSRITLEITGIRVERLQDISESDAIAEGCAATSAQDSATFGDSNLPSHQFKNLWKTINGQESWDSNPFVWVIEFTRRAQP